MNLLLVDDEAPALAKLRRFLADDAQVRVAGEASDGDAALAFMAANPGAVDAVLLDIQMPGRSGLEVAAALPPHVLVAFATAFDEHAVQAFELNAVDYLLKPFTRERFDAAVDRVLAERGAPAEILAQSLEQARGKAAGPLERILVRDRGRIFPLVLDEIAYLKADSKYTAIVARGRTFLVRIGISELEARLDPKRFVRIHRSALVNLDFVESMKADEQSLLELEMRDGTRLTASREASRMLRELAI